MQQNPTNKLGGVFICRCTQALCSVLTVWIVESIFHQDQDETDE